MLRLISFGLTDGGTAGLIYGFIVVWVGFTMVYLSISEMASMLVLLHPLALTQSLTPLNRAPTSGGRKLIILIACFCHAALDFRQCCLTRKKRKRAGFPYTSRLDVKPVSSLSKHMLHANRELRVSLGVGIRSAQRPKIPQLHHW